MKGEPGRDGLEGLDGVQGPPGNVLIIPNSASSTKGPDNSMQEMIKQAMANLVGPRGPVGLTGLPGPSGMPGKHCQGIGFLNNKYPIKLLIQ